MKVRNARSRPPSLLVLDHLERGRAPERRIVGQSALALDQPARDIARHRLHDVGQFVALRQHGAAVARVLHETVLPLVAAHLDMRDDVDPQPRHVAARQAAVEQIDVLGDFVEHRIERVVEQFEAGDVGVAQIDHDGGALGRLDARFAHRVLERRGRGRRGGLIGLFAASEHWLNLASSGPRAKPKTVAFQGSYWLTRNHAIGSRPAEAGLGAGARPIFGADPAGVAEPVDRGEHGG